jgi:hypothetical protein
VIHEKWTDSPIPVWAADNQGFDPIMDSDRLLAVPPVMDLYMTHPGGVTFRGVSLKRLPAILTAGVDVEPTDSIIYCDFISKAYEYGGDDKVIMAFRYFGSDEQHLVRRAVTQILPATSAEDADERRRLYPHDLGPNSAGNPRLCRVKPKTHADFTYLRTYGYFIPDNPWDALVGLFIYGNPDTLASVRTLVEMFVASTRAST